jgi:hypothetical protein
VQLPVVEPAGGDEPASTLQVAHPLSVSGAGKVGSTLRGTAPTWTTPPSRVVYQWQLCTAKGCVAIPHANKLTLKITPAYAGRTVRLVVTARLGGTTVKTFSKKVSATRR